MNTLVVGSGGREHALARKLAQSPRVERVLVTPGNGGTDGLASQSCPSKIHNLKATITPEDNFAALIASARQEHIDLTVVGPEIPLAAGIVDAFMDAGLRCFGPKRAAARLEGSKAYAKAFMTRHGIPTARCATFTGYPEALAHLRGVDYQVVIKASGLAAGKGVIVPDSLPEAENALSEIMLGHAFGAAGDEVLIEERLFGPEASVLAFCDGRTVIPMPAAQDHKRVFDDDQGPNTGGMGAYAPTPLVTPALREEILHTVLQPVVDGMRAEGTPYVGVLYAGLMFTEHGLRVLEFNCRFGDPETQVILPLLENDLTLVIEACLDGRLDREEVYWRYGAAATVVACSEGYPDSYPKGLEITGIERAEAVPGVQVYHAGTCRAEDGRLLTAGGRVLNITAIGDDLPQALRRAYAGIERIRFAGMHYRHDIGSVALTSAPAPSWQKAPLESRVHEGTAQDQVSATRTGLTYRDAGVDIAAGARAVELMKESVRSTYGPEVLLGIGAFGGLFEISALKAMNAPVLVASTDGVGTKTRIAAALGRFDTVGHDIVNHCVNDILVQGARPLFFQDYIASSRLDAENVATVVRGCAAACRQVGCALLGGETAEMPGVYAPCEFDLVGTIVGIVDRDQVIDGTDILPGDAIIGLASSGLHTNGYSLARRVLEGRDFHTYVPELGRSLGEALLEPHRAYLADVQRLWEAEIRIKGMAHITGGGLIDNPPRIFPDGLAARLRRGSWPILPVFRLIQQAGQIDDAEMAHVFNLGLGMLLIVPSDQAAAALDALGRDAWIVGEMTPQQGNARVEIV